MKSEVEKRAAILRMCRAYTGVHQKDAAERAGVSERTLLDAEMGQRCSERTWDAMMSFFSGVGIELRDGQPMVILIDERELDIFHPPPSL